MNVFYVSIFITNTEMKMFSPWFEWLGSNGASSSMNHLRFGQGDGDKMHYSLSITNSGDPEWNLLHRNSINRILYTTCYKETVLNISCNVI